MEYIEINGGRELSGEIVLSGSKNSALPILACSLLSDKSINLSKYKVELEKKFKIKIDYLEFRDEKKMRLNHFKSKYRLFIAYYINKVRLIDNF